MASRKLAPQKRASIQTIPPEVMSIIFGMIDKRTCVATCLVCRRWSGAAIDELWRSLPSLLPLFKLLGPLIDTDTDYDLHPDCVVTVQSWDIFRSYARRVRSLTYNEVFKNDGISAGLIIRAIAANPEGILPNLREVFWELYASTLDHPLAFCPPSLERMSIYIEDELSLVESVERFLHALSTSLANRLKFFEFGTGSPPSRNAAIATALNTFLRGQGGLVELKLPFYEIQDPGTVYEVCQASLQLRAFCAEVHNITKDRFREVLGALAMRSASLRCVRLIWSTSESPIEGPIRLTDMEPVFQLSDIEDFRLWLGCGLELEVRDIQQMGQAWKGLTSLILLLEGPGIPLPRLVTFAQWLPLLQQLAAHFDCSEHIPSADEVPSRFRSLHRLILLDAEIEDWQMPLMAELLVVVCGPKVEVRVTRDYSRDPHTFLHDLELWKAGSEDQELRDRMGAFCRVHRAMKRME
ncbi:hypothetical protein FS837_012220 [Tulasnella sp. UAMH 9824]|nr:hypothetical protein FS837_012220 [Tulasnella sp. UAMH 9824]